MIEKIELAARYNLDSTHFVQYGLEMRRKTKVSNFYNMEESIITYVTWKRKRVRGSGSVRNRRSEIF